jgi:hypothetical protein
MSKYTKGIRLLPSHKQHYFVGRKHYIASSDIIAKKPVRLWNVAVDSQESADRRSKLQIVLIAVQIIMN